MAEAGRAELAARHRLLTHCNTGRLATAGLGTALGVVYAKAAASEPVQVLASETRPLLQGARLTAWELVNAGIPVTVVADTAAGAAMAGGLVDAVLVGCDRVAANGDTANKIGTYSLAVLARRQPHPLLRGRAAVHRSTPRPPTAPPSRSSSARPPRSARSPAPQAGPGGGRRLEPGLRRHPGRPDHRLRHRRRRAPAPVRAVDRRRPGAGLADDGVGPQPARGGLGGRLAVGHLEVEPGQLGGGELGADRVAEPHQRRAVGVQDLAAQDRDHVVGRLEAPVVLELDQVGA